MSRKLKGVSPIIATLLLVLISIAAAALIYVFVTGYISGSAPPDQYAQSQIVIEAASLKISSSNLNVTVYVRNVGQQAIPTGDWSVYVYHTDGTMIGANTTLNQDALPPGQILKFDARVDNNTSINPGEYYDIKVVSPAGTFDVVRVRASP